MASSTIIKVPVTSKEKLQLLKLAKSANTSVSEYLRKCAFSNKATSDEYLPEMLINQMNKSTISANDAIDDALAYVEESNKRIEMIENVR
jgi:hypothetical protein